MAEIIRVKAKKEYEWNQDKKYVYVQIPLPAHSSLKKVDIFLSDLILRVTSLEKKQTHSLDLLHEIDFRSPENKFVITDGLLHATLRKAAIDQQWSSLLIEQVSLAELKIRRRQSEARYEEATKQQQETKEKLRIDYDRKATQELMRFQQQERQKLEQRKEKEKEAAIREVFSGIDEKSGRIEKPHKQLQIEREEDKWREKERLALQLLSQQQEQERILHSKQLKEKQQSKIVEVVKKQQNATVLQNQTMFTEQDLNRMEQDRLKVQEEIQFEEIPIRKANNQKVKFTQKIFPNLAARDTFYKQPPMPKNKENKAIGGDLESKNPLWLKDKGDGFYKDKNYVSAIEAYSQAIKLDSKFTKAYMNRSICYQKLFKVRQAIEDCDQSLLLMQSQISASEEEQVRSKLTFAKIKTRKAICLAWKGELEAAKKLIGEVQELELDEQTKIQVHHCLQQIQRREQSIKLKIKGDQLVKVNQYTTALTFYQKSIMLDFNQYAISNKVLCLNKLQDHKKAVQCAGEGVKKIIRFNVAVQTSTQQDKNSCLLLLKLHYRKAKAHEELGEFTEAEEEVRKGLMINSDDKDLKDYLAFLKRRKSKETIKKLKEQCVGLLKEGKVNEALENYSKCLKILEQHEDVVEYLAILQNQCVCYQKLEKFDDILSICIRILKLVNAIESKVLSFGEKKEAAISKEELRKISVRTLMRRANAYVKTQQFYNAKSDLEKALEINQDEEIKKELQKLYEKLKAQLQS